MRSGGYILVDRIVTEADETSGLNAHVERIWKVKLWMYKLQEIVDSL